MPAPITATCSMPACHPDSSRFSASLKLRAPPGKPWVLRNARPRPRPSSTLNAGLVAGPLHRVDEIVGRHGPGRFDDRLLAGEVGARLDDARHQLQRPFHGAHAAAAIHTLDVQ